MHGKMFSAFEDFVTYSVTNHKKIRQQTLIE